MAEQEPSLCVNEVKTEIIDLDILTDDSIEYPAFEQEFKDYSSLAVKYNGNGLVGVCNV